MAKTKELLRRLSRYRENSLYKESIRDYLHVLQMIAAHDHRTVVGSEIYWDLLLNVSWTF